MARERYLVHQGEETIHSEKLEHTPQTPKEKRQYFWYYHKWHILIGVVAAILLGFIIYDFASKVEPDYQIGLITEYDVPENVVQDMENKLQLGAKDRNGDGKVVVQISNYALGGENSNAQITAASVTRLMGDFTTYSDMMFICDSKGYDYIQQQEGWDSSNVKMPMPSVMKYDGYSFTVNMRVLDKEGDKKYTEHKEYWDASKEIYENAMSAKTASKAS